MNTNARSASLPWMAAAVAAVVTTMWFLLGLRNLLALPSPPAHVVAMSLTAFIGSLVFRTGLAYLIARWHGERHGQLAFRRPVRLLAVYALCLLGWQAVQPLLQMLLFRALTPSVAGNLVYMNFVMTILILLRALLYALVTWLAWRFVTYLLRNDALPEAPAGNARLCVAGLAAWMLASVLLSLLPLAVPLLLERFDDDLGLLVSDYVGAAAIPVVLAFVGTLLGLPRGLNRLHGLRVLGASFAAMVCVSLLAYGTPRALESLHLAANSMAGLLIVIVFAGIGAAYWLWARVFYAGTGGVPVASPMAS